MYGNGFSAGGASGVVSLSRERGAAEQHSAEGVRRATARAGSATLAELDEAFLEETEHHAQVEAAIRNYETAYRMQSAVPELTDISDESRGDEEALWAGLDKRVDGGVRATVPVGAAVGGARRSVCGVDDGARRATARWAIRGISTDSSTKGIWRTRTTVDQPVGALIAKT